MEIEKNNQTNIPNRQTVGRMTLELNPEMKKSKVTLVVKQLIIWLAVYLAITAVWFFSE